MSWRPVIVAFVVATIVSLAALFVFLLERYAMAFIGFHYSVSGLERVDRTGKLFLAAVAAFDLTAIVGTLLRWRYVVPAGALLLLVAGAIAYVMLTAGYS